MGSPSDTGTGTGTTTIAAYRATAETIRQEQRKLAAELNTEVTMPEMLLRIVVEWQSYRDERRQHERPER